MFARLTLTTAVLLIAVSPAGCNGPTKAGKEARAAANARMNLVSAQIQYDQAQQLFSTGQFDRALREINSAIARYPDASEYHVLQGRIHLETHQLEAAEQSFTTAMQKDPANAEAHYFAGIVYQRWSDDEEAFRHYHQAFELDSTKVQYLLAAAESLIALGEFEQAKQLIEPKLAHFEHNAALRQLQAQIELLQGNPKRAAALFSQARLLNPDDNMLLEELMWAQYAAEMYGQCHESIKTLQSRIKEPRTDLMHLEARCLTMMRRGPEARELYMRLTQMRPSDPILWSELGTLAWDLGDYRRVAQCSTQLIALAPSRYEGYLLRGVNERQKGNLMEAAKYFREAAGRSPDIALPHLLLGQTLEQLDDIDGAMSAYHGALQADPGSIEAQGFLRRLNESQRVTAVPTP